MKGILELQKFVTPEKTVKIRVIVRGNVGSENRAKLDSLGMTPVIDIANTREKFVDNPQELDLLRDALVAENIVYGPSETHD